MRIFDFERHIASLVTFSAGGRCPPGPPSRGADPAPRRGLGGPWTPTFFRFFKISECHPWYHGICISGILESKAVGYWGVWHVERYHGVCILGILKSRAGGWWGVWHVEGYRGMHITWTTGVQSGGGVSGTWKGIMVCVYREYWSPKQSGSGVSGTWKDIAVCISPGQLESSLAVGCLARGRVPWCVYIGNTGVQSGSGVSGTWKDIMAYVSRISGVLESTRVVGCLFNNGFLSGSEVSGTWKGIMVCVSLEYWGPVG